MSNLTAPIVPKGTRNSLVEAARKAASDAKGKPYVYGGKDTSGFDCSGFVSYVYQRVFPSFTYVDTSHIECGGPFAEVSAPNPGDVILFSAGTNPYESRKGNNKKWPTHVGVVLDANSWIGSQSSTGAAVVPMSNPWWSERKHKFFKYSGMNE